MCSDDVMVPFQAEEPQAGHTLQDAVTEVHRLGNIVHLLLQRTASLEEQVYVD